NENLNSTSLAVRPLQAGCMQKRKEAANKGRSKVTLVWDVRVGGVFGILATTQASFVSLCHRFCASRHHQARVSTEMLRLPGPGGTRPAARLCLACNAIKVARPCSRDRRIVANGKMRSRETVSTQGIARC